MLYDVIHLLVSPADVIVDAKHHRSIIKVIGLQIVPIILLTLLAVIAALFVNAPFLTIPNVLGAGMILIIATLLFCAIFGKIVSNVVGILAGGNSLFEGYSSIALPLTLLYFGIFNALVVSALVYFIPYIGLQLAIVSAITILLYYFASSAALFYRAIKEFFEIDYVKSFIVVSIVVALLAYLATIIYLLLPWFIEVTLLSFV